MYSPLKAVEGIDVQTGRHVLIAFRDGFITDVQIKEVEEGNSLPWIGPGLVDLQINGYNGLDYNTLPISKELVQKVTEGLWSEGVTSYFPTVITNGDEEIEEAVRSISKSSSQEPWVCQSICGIHLEGPFISPEDGPRGAHSRKYVKGPDWSLFQRWQAAADGKIKMITLSPEWPGCSEFIEKCTDSGVIVSIGHTSAAPEQIIDAVAAGARMSTHLGNGAHLMLPRHPNYLWEQLAQDELWTCLIADGFHLPESFLKVVLKIKGPQAMLVSDAVYLSGLEAGEYETHIGGKVVLHPSGRLSLAENPNILAGSAQMLTRGIAHLVHKGLCSLSAAWEMASIRPSKFMKLPTAKGLTVGAPADFVVFEWDHNKINIVQTYKQGNLVYKKASEGVESNH